MSSRPLGDALDRAFTQLRLGRESFDPKLAPREVGFVTRISTGIARVAGLPGAGFEERVLFPGGNTRMTAVFEPLAPICGALTSSAPHLTMGAFVAAREPANVANSGYSYLATVTTAGNFFVATVWLPPLMIRSNSKRLFLYSAPVT